MHKKLFYIRRVLSLFRLHSTSSSRVHDNTLPVLTTTPTTENLSGLLVMPSSSPPHWPHTRVTGATRKIRPPGPKWRTPHQRTVCEHFFRSPNKLPGGFQTDWEQWAEYSILGHINWYDRTPMDVYQAELRFAGTVRPLAFFRCSEVCFLFEAGGKYYLLDLEGDYLGHYGDTAGFASDEDFLARHLDMNPRRQRFPRGMDDRYLKVARKQETLWMKKREGGALT
ncbi:hypothetical protein C8R43DRAFT_1106506 [Mycena crocata]|nr:hypothetical protein C8R43DRAFT_1106506 [Mycena crocata]